MRDVADIEKEMKDNDILILLIPNQNYADRINNIVEASTRAFNKICYTTTNRPYATLLASFEKRGIKTERIIFIDSATGSFKKIESKSKVIFISSPRALTEMNIEINKVIDKENVKQMLFDSLSTLLVYEQTSTVIKFSHSIISKLRSSNVKAVLTCLKDDMDSEIIKDLSMFVDKMVEIE
ncbi:MAG: hypothetical protein ABIH52_04735 [Candidatus Aenigmatarchaeota archaeon]